jgi:uncharacterized membrane protein YkvA (DUF1232 family)
MSFEREKRISIITRWKKRIKLLNNDIKALSIAYSDPRVPWYAKAFMAAVIGYAISPIDLIPDFIPILGYLDDLIIVPAGIYLAIKMIPRGIMNECREKAAVSPFSSRVKWVIAGVIILIWLLVIFLIIKFIRQAFF